MSGATVRINCGVDVQPQRGIGAYSAMIHTADGMQDPISGVIEEGATFIRCCLMAAVAGFEAVTTTGEDVEVVTPSTWVAETVGDADGFARLRANGWVNEDGTETVHRDLLERLAIELDDHDTVSWRVAADVGRQERAATPESEAAEHGSQSADAEPPDCYIRYAAATVGDSGVGAYCIEIRTDDRVEKVSSKFQTTNFARMHLTTCIEALRETRRLLKRDAGLRIVLDTPHELTANAVNRGWLDEWARNRWNRREGDRVHNADLWQDLNRFLRRHDVEIRHVIDSAVSDLMLNEAETLAKREVQRGQQEGASRESEDAAVNEGKLIRIFTSGATPAPEVENGDNDEAGGWAAIMEVRGKKGTQSKGYKRTTAERMQLIAAAETLDFLVKLKSGGKLDDVENFVVNTDSEYLASAMNRGWAKRWRKNQWNKQGGTKAQNTDLWKRILRADDRLKSVEFRTFGNGTKAASAYAEERRACTRLAAEAAQQPDGELLEDAGYEGP